MDELVQFYLRSLRDVLAILDVDGKAALRIAALVYQGNLDSGLVAEQRLGQTPGGLAGMRAALPPLIEALAEYTPRFLGTELAVAEFEATAGILSGIGEVVEALGIPAMAYNFHESAYALLSEADRPALHCAETLRRLSNPEKIDQYHAAIWKLATERLRHACDHRTDWLAALDAIELALTCPVPHIGLQQALFAHLLTQVLRARETDVQELVAIVAVQAPPTAVDPKRRMLAIAALAERRAGPLPSGSDPAVLELLANAEAQTMFDDMRLKLLPRPAIKPRIDGHDLTYRDDRLSDAVPLGLSLIADPRRTAKLLLDMAHEIGHAVVLQGALGTQQAVYRAVVTQCEFMLLNVTSEDPEGMPLERLAALAELPDADVVRTLAETQLVAAQAAAVERAIWRPWLEGVSMYIELLCDPKDDPSEISVVHECIRSLIDFNVPRLQGEEEQAYVDRYSQITVDQFEAFLSDAIAKKSWFGHLAYFDTGDASTPARDVYALGYLIVRSVVAAWEKTLGRRLAPGLAVKLLLNATQAGTFEALADPLDGPAAHGEQTRLRHLAWLRSLAGLDREALADCFDPADPDGPGASWLWQDGRPHRVNAEDAAVKAALEEQSTRFKRRTALLAGLDPDTQDETERLYVRALLAALTKQIEWNRLLPIGADRARLTFLGTPGLVSLAVRTYAGDELKSAQAARAAAAGGLTGPGLVPTAADAHDPRYNIRAWRLEGGGEEADRLRQAFGRAGSGRVRATRIVDLGGHPDAPHSRRGASYVCAFLPPDFTYVLDARTRTDIAKSHPAFTQLLVSRLFPPVAFPDEQATIASLSFLGRRATRSRLTPPLPPSMTDEALATLAQDVAFAAAALAFGGSAEQFRAAYESAMRARRYRQALVGALHASGRGLPPKPENAVDQPALAGEALSRRLFGAAAFSAITPFGGMA